MYYSYSMCIALFGWIFNATFFVRKERSIENILAIVVPLRYSNYITLKMRARVLKTIQIILCFVVNI